MSSTFELDLSPIRTALPLPHKTNVAVASPASRFNFDFPAFFTEGLHEAKQVNQIDSCQSLVFTSRARDYLWVEMMLHEIWPLCFEVAYRAIHAQLENLA